MTNLSREMTPPAALEDRVVDALRARGLLAPSAPRVGRGRRHVLRVAAALLLFAGGYAAGNWRAMATTASPSTGTAHRFVLLLHGVGGPATPAEQAARVDEYRAWARLVRLRGVAINGEKLKSAAGGSISGFFIIEAPSLEVARQIADSCPHARHGSVELREIDPT